MFIQEIEIVKENPECLFIFDGKLVALESRYSEGTYKLNGFEFYYLKFSYADDDLLGKNLILEPFLYKLSHLNNGIKFGYDNLAQCYNKLRLCLPKELQQIKKDIQNNKIWISYHNKAESLKLF